MGCIYGIIVIIIVLIAVLGIIASSNMVFWNLANIFTIGGLVFLLVFTLVMNYREKKEAVFRLKEEAIIQYEVNAVEKIELHCLHCGYEIKDKEQVICEKCGNSIRE